MQQPIYSIKNLSISNNGHKILNINKFDLHRGAMYLFNGYIGSGKTTLMQVFSKQKPTEKGMIFYFIHYWYKKNRVLIHLLRQEHKI